MGIMKKDGKIAVINIGYADGYHRFLGNGKAQIMVKNNLAPTIGNICMDMTMIDISDIEEVKDGDVVTIFGENPKIEVLAKEAQTIVYEILTSISNRVERIYLSE